MDKDNETASGKAWDSPGIDNHKFDVLLDDIINYTSDLYAGSGPDNIYSTIYMALYDPDLKIKNWGSVGILEYPQDTEDQVSIFTAAGKVVVGSGQVPIAVFWLKEGKMVISTKEGTTEHNGYMILGMTEDFRVNGAFLPVLEGETQPPLTFYASDMDNKNTLDVEYLYEVFKSAKTEYLSARDKGYVAPDTDDLTRQLFKKANKKE